MRVFKRTFSPALLVIAVASLVACGGNDPEKMVGSAKAYLAKDDPKAAIIELKTALQAAPESAEARFLLGKALLATGDVAGAALELRKALDLRFDENEVAPELARALMLQGDYQRLLEQFGQTVLSQSMAEADLKVTLARANGGLGRREAARTAALAALKAVPDYGPANVFMARLQADTGDIDGALSELEKQLGRTPQDAEAWQVKGDLLLAGKRDLDGALAAFRQSIAVKPNYVPAHSGAMTILLGKQDLEGAKAQLAQLQKVLPNHPQTLYFAGNLALLGKELDKAREIAQQLLRVSPNNPRVLQLAGGVEVERKAWAQAEAHLAKALQLKPDLELARRMLVLTHLQRSEPAKALAVLQPLLERANPPGEVYALKAQAHLQAGDLDQAEAAYTKAAKLNPEDKRSRTALAMSKVLRGTDGGSGLDELRSLAAGEDTTVADLPLIGALVRKKDFQGALAAIDHLERKQPDKPVAANLRARVLMLQGNKEGAIKAYRRALEIQPSFYPAAASLAQMAMADKRPEDAKALLDGVLKADPANAQALIGSAALRARAGAPREEIVGMFARAIQQAPADPAPRLALINYHLSNKDVKAALDAAQQATAALPDNPTVLDALGRAQAASGDANQAIASFGKLAQMVPSSAAPHLRIADVHWANKKPEAAIEALKRALGVDSDNLQAQRTLVDAYLAVDKAAEAVTIARQIRQQRPKEDVGFLVEGGIEASQGRWPQAIALYRDGLKVAAGSTELATRLHVGLMSTKQEAEANRFASDWLRLQPNDPGFRFYLGDLALSKKSFAVAESNYREVLKLQPNNPLALNNVAWLMATAKKPGAVAMAQKAVELLPDRPIIMDTLAMALASEGQMPQAVDMMRKALALEDKNPQLRFNLAKLLIQSGDKAGAKTELNTIAQLGSKFPRQGEVTELLKTL
jgi:putative PEP-CTERM system TPR-repeat lipoprotein